MTSKIRWVSAVGLGAFLLAGLGWYASTIFSTGQQSSNPAPTTPSNLGLTNPIANSPDPANPKANNPVPNNSSQAPAGEAINLTPQPPTAIPAPTDLPQLLTQRLAAAAELFAKHTPNSASIQLFYTTEPQSERLEAFLKRADALGKIAEIYIQPTRINGKDGYRVLYGNYPNPDVARSGIKQLPQRYKDGFTPAIFLLNSAAAGK